MVIAAALSPRLWLRGAISPKLLLLRCLLLFWRRNTSLCLILSLFGLVRMKGSEPTPPRIMSNVKQNLQFLKLWKEFQKRKSSTPKPATSYRRKKVEKEDLPEDTEFYRDPSLSLYYTNQGIDNAIPVLLVDGYNVCGYWIKLKKHFMNGRLDIARQKLIDELVTFSMLREVKVVAVFDAMMSGLPTHKENFFGVDVVYSSETCADAWIEKEVVALKEDGCPKVWVVTSDRCQQQAAHGAGAFVWSCKALVSEIKSSQKEVEMMLQEQRCAPFMIQLCLSSLFFILSCFLFSIRKCNENMMSFSGFAHRISNFGTN
ncbi:hypothetical protein F0562_029133 [Nyssa sinensis]|uniref:NYN domain-containing protein n=1 Tax=Nyssa sinensis TaxID=561372 RepID=A0A5J5B072_9ASTE|nr:hypothetical protein F0562_029133 [Nyssa sinensis]